MDDLGDYIVDDDLAIEPFRDLGWEVEKRSWRSEKEDWSIYDAVVVRSTWDYHKAHEEFLRVLNQIHQQTRLENPLKLIEWNIRKTYLRDLSEFGLNVIPTLFGDGAINRNLFADWQKRFSTSEIVVKPIVSATAKDTFRFRGFDPILEKIFLDREYMVQPFAHNIVTEGEYSLFYFDGGLSHASQKVPKQGDFRVQEDFGGTNKLIIPDEELKVFGRSVIEFVDPVALYARVDFVRDSDGELALMELELIEPSLYFRIDDEAATRFAGAFHKRMNEL